MPFFLPSMDRGTMVIIPPKQILKVYNRPEDVIDMHNTADDTLQTSWTIGDPKFHTNDFQMNVVRIHITRNLTILTLTIAREIASAFEKFWGASREYAEIDVWASCQQLVGAASNSIFTGPDLCKNEEFLRQLPSHGMSILGGALVINMMPRILKPLVGTLVYLNCRYWAASAEKMCMPIVVERLQQNARLKYDPKHAWSPPADGLQWVIEEAYKSGDPDQLQPQRICTRVLFLSTVSLHSTAFTAQNVILDLYSTDPSLGYVEKLREEAATVLAEAGGSWTRAAVTKLEYIDSMVRESMRMNPFAIVGLPRTVAAKEGIMLKNLARRVPQGQMLAVPLEPVHFDEDIYPDAHQFYPFRFIEPGKVRSIFQAFDSSAARDGARINDTEPKDSTTARGKSTATLDEAFLGFGFGKFACPGRFFALNEVKLLVAHMLLTYDVEPLKERPKPIDTVWLKLPFHGAKIRARKRVVSS